MKKTSKTKAVSPTKNNLKITDLFKDKTHLLNVPRSKVTSSMVNDFPDSEDEFMSVPTKSKTHPITSNKETVEDEKRVKRKSEDVVDGTNHKKIHFDLTKTQKCDTLSPNVSLDLTNCTILNEKIHFADNLHTPVLDELSEKGQSSSNCKQEESSTHDKNNDANKITSASTSKSQPEFPYTENLSEMTSILNMDFDAWEDDILETPEEFTLDLTKPHHCKIISISRMRQNVLLTLTSTTNKRKGFCTLEGFWTYTNLAVGDTVYINGNKIDDKWIVNNDHGLIVFEPDILVSSTAVVGSLYCKRKSLLSERFRGFDTSNQYMLLGNLIHSLFQFSIKNSVTDTVKLEELIKKNLKSGRVLKTIYECNISTQWLETELLSYIPKIQEFMKMYVNKINESETIRDKDNWKGKINSIEDIEENIWCPELGIKGKIDVTIKDDTHIMPLELKSGRASLSLEHKGQVMIYLMMMKNIGYNVSSGLLLYLKEIILREISLTHKEERDLMNLRNELVYYMNQSPEIIDKQTILLPKLPEPVNHNGCKRCPYSTICTAYAYYNNEDISSKKVLKEIQQQNLEFLSVSQIEYFMKWTCLLIVESESNLSTKNMKEIYTISPEVREKNGKCISNLKLVKVVEEPNEVFCEHIFEKNDNCHSINVMKNGIYEHGYVIVSTTKRHSVAAGYVNNLTNNTLSVLLERNLDKKYRDEIFSIDSYDSNIIQIYNLSSLSLLLECSPRANDLRKIIIDKEAPTFKATLPKKIGTVGRPILLRLNKVQQRAVLKAITANDYFLIKGMPGTGKTATIVALIQLLYELQKTILITSHTNSAVDNVCLKLLQYGVKFMRLGADTKIHKDLLEFSERNLTKHCASPEEYETVYNSTQIFAVTCMASGHPVLTRRNLDICIVDESTQVLQCSVIRPLYVCKTFILIGDPDQLPAVVKSQTAKNFGMSESLFERLYTEDAATSLNINYRMNSKITSFANNFTYNGELEIGSETIANATLPLTNKNVLKDIYGDESWMSKVLDDSLDKAVQFIDTGPVWNLTESVEWKINKSYVRHGSEDNHTSNVNIYEAALIFQIVDALLKGGVEPSSIGVIATYRHQVDQISDILKFASVDVNTVDQFQGKDKSVIIYSCANSKDTSVFKVPKNDDILEDKRRLTVAITRAKHKLIIIGDIKTLMVYSTFKKLLPFFKNIIRLYEYKDFMWKNVLSLEPL